MTLQDELDATYKAMADVEARRQAIVDKMNAPVRELAGRAHGFISAAEAFAPRPSNESLREELAQLNTEWARLSSRRWELEAKKRGPQPAIEYHHSPAERARLEALRDEQSAI
jgi:hypothetical protein